MGILNASVVNDKGEAVDTGVSRSTVLVPVRGMESVLLLVMK